MKNYYKILGVEANATADDIKRAYRTLAKKYHPDVNPDDGAAAEKFADVNEAYTVLGDDQARKVYDNRLRESAAQSGRQRPDNVDKAQARYRANTAAGGGTAYNRQQSGGQAWHITVPAQLGAQIQAVIRAQVAANLKAAQNSAFASGRARGAAEARAAAKAEIDRLNTAADELVKEKRKARSELVSVERDRRDLENELFNRDRELAQEKIRAKELEERVKNLADAHGSSGETAALRELLDMESARCETAEREKAQAESAGKAREKQLYDSLRAVEAELADTKARLDKALAECAELRADAMRSGGDGSNTGDYEKPAEECIRIIKAEIKRAVPTLYGTLGVLAVASRDDITKAYKDIAAKCGAVSDGEVKKWFAAVGRAYAVLSNDAKRAEYDRSVGISTAEAARNAKYLADNEWALAEYRSRRASAEFWQFFDELIVLGLRGDAQSQNALGEIYYSGDDIERDFDQAAFWFKEAVKKKNTDAMYNLGVCYINGEGTDMNKAVGLSYIRQAAVRR